jgi:hypothetical protein
MIIKNISKLLMFCSLLTAVAFSSCSASKGVNSSVKVNVTNNSNIDKKDETVEVAWVAFKKMGTINPLELIVMDLSTNKEIPSQVIYYGQILPQSIIFQVDIASNAKKDFRIRKGKPANYPKKVFGRQVPERLDDFAWENNRVAFRMYGEALENQQGMAKGIDFWAKRTEDLIVNELYKGGKYHQDNGEAVDAYHVGMTLGSGDAEPIVGGKIIYPINYSSSKILDQGPIRISFKLMYKPFMVDGKMVTETKTVSLDAGTQMNKIINHYESSNKNLTIAAGVTKHTGDGKSKLDLENNYVGYWDLGDGKVNGYIGVGVVMPSKSVKEIKDTKEHLLILSKLNNNNDLEYYQGGGWSKSGNFNDENAWFTYLKNFSQSLKQPLNVSVK